MNIDVVKKKLATGPAAKEKYLAWKKEGIEAKLNIDDNFLPKLLFKKQKFAYGQYLDSNTMTTQNTFSTKFKFCRFLLSARCHFKGPKNS